MVLHNINMLSLLKFNSIKLKFICIALFTIQISSFTKISFYTISSSSLSVVLCQVDVHMAEMYETECQSVIDIIKR